MTIEERLLNIIEKVLPGMRSNSLEAEELPITEEKESASPVDSFAESIRLSNQQVLQQIQDQNKAYELLQNQFTEFVEKMKKPPPEEPVEDIQSVDSPAEKTLSPLPPAPAPAAANGVTRAHKDIFVDMSAKNPRRAAEYFKKNSRSILSDAVFFGN